MNLPTPHFLLYSAARHRRVQGDWNFRLEAADGSQLIEAADVESQIDADRLELLAVVRGLEALDQPSRVTLVTSSRYVQRGIANGLEEWRSNDWRWECFGQLVPVRDYDLWQRVDRALHFHHVECRALRLEGPQSQTCVQRPRAATTVQQNRTAGVTSTLAGALERLTRWGHQYSPQAAG